MNELEATSYEQNPSEQHARWVVEFAAARKALESWQGAGDKIDAEFRNENPSGEEFDTRLPLFTSDVNTIISMLYGQVPKASVTRRFGDSDDDVSRVAGVILERILNTDISRQDDTYAVALRCALMDFFLPGFAGMRCRYVTGKVETEEVAAEVDGATGKVLVEGYKNERRPDEDIEVDYVHWKDWLWGPAKVVHMVPWWAHRSQMTRAELVERFKAVGKLVPLAKRKDGSEDPWARAEVWEIYEKAERRVYWMCESFDRLLDMQDDPLKLEGFYPFPSEPLMANLTTSKVVPRPYYALHQDQYKQVNALMSRIRELVEAVRVAGFYDESNESLMTLLSLPGRNKLFPVKNWAKLQGDGGMAEAIQWFPLGQIVEGITLLQGQLATEIDLLHQTTGFSDIMRGEATQAGATATEQRAKTKFGSVRVQRLQDEIARYATDVLRIKGEMVCKLFTPETILERANVRFMTAEDQAVASQAIELLKSNYACYRIEVKPEAVALADFAAMKAERTEVLTALTGYFQVMQPIAQQMPQSLPYLLKIGKWTVAGVRGASEIEGVFDQMVKAAEQAAAQAAANPQPAQQDPKLQAEQTKLQGVQMKAAADMQREEFKLQAALTQGQAEVQNDNMREENQRIQNVKESAQKQMISNALKPPTSMTNGRGRP